MPTFPITAEQRRDDPELEEIIGILNQSFTMRDVAIAAGRLEDKGYPVVKLNIGEPGFDSPEVMIAAQKKAIDNKVGSRYINFGGDPDLKAALHNFLTSVGIDGHGSKDNIIPTTGGMMGNFRTLHVLSHAMPDRKEVVMFAPYFPPAYRQILLHGLTPAIIPINPDGDSAGRLEHYLRRHHERILTFNITSPNNPLGTVFSANEQEVMAKVADEYEIPAWSDDAYMMMVHRGNYHHISQFSDYFVAVISSSKNESNPGDRIGANVLSERLADRRFEALKRGYGTDRFGNAMALHMFITDVNPGASAGRGVAAAWNNEAELIRAGQHGYIATITEEYGRRVRRIIDSFQNAGFEVIGDPAGGLYACFTHPAYQDESPYMDLMLQTGVAVQKLSIFGGDPRGIRTSASAADDKSLGMLEAKLAEFRPMERK